MTRSPFPFSHCGGIAKRKWSPSWAMVEMGRALPTKPTNRPTRARRPEGRTKDTTPEAPEETPEAPAEEAAAEETTES